VNLPLLPAVGPKGRTVYTYVHNFKYSAQLVLYQVQERAVNTVNHIVKTKQKIEMLNYVSGTSGKILKYARRTQTSAEWRDRWVEKPTVGDNSLSFYRRIFIRVVNFSASHKRCTTLYHFVQLCATLCHFVGQRALRQAIKPTT
jgi:hypothetical protein